MHFDARIAANPTAAAQRARRTEEAGYDGIWVSETNHDPFPALTLAADSTERIEVGSDVVVALARSPMTTAYLAWDLQTLARGRFILGLGSQIRPHVTRRFDMPWSKPAARMQEYIEALHAIWDTWESGTRLDFRGEFYEHTLMTPMFAPPPQSHGRPKVYLGAVGPLMAQAAGRVADGLLCHSLATADYLREVTLPEMRKGQEDAGRTAGTVAVSATVLVVAAESSESLESQARGTRRTIALTGTVPAYGRVLEHHGWGDAHDELRALSKQGRWTDMPDVIDDEMLRTIAAVGTPAEVADTLVARYGDLADRLALVTTFDSTSTDPGTDSRSWTLLLEQLRRAVADRRPTTPDSLRPPG